MGYISWIRSKVGTEPIILNFGAACVVDDGRVLLQRRHDRDAWGFPGGAVEFGESVADAAQRETREETGLTVVVQDLLGVYSKYFDQYPSGDRAQVITTFLICRPVGGEFSTADPETLELRYFDLSKPPTLANQQHEDAYRDLAHGRRSVVR